MEISRNNVELWGVAEESPVISHENHGQRFFKFPLRVERLSGLSDVPVIVVPENKLLRFPISTRQSVRVTGQLRSFNNKSGQGSRLVITVLAQELSEGDGRFLNRISLCGALCKQPYLRRTPLGRSICDVILAVNRNYGRADYLPCIAWGQVASEVSCMSVGDMLSFDGRVQSRIYTKLLDTGPEERTAFEVSIMQLTNTNDES
ncbi:MAG: single-stranded DNA-binding protein [Oscillospiraceae bacterium]|nr:single-stranded DNA-binding protein [Oscillospiraceae bacterium]